MPTLRRLGEVALVLVASALWAAVLLAAIESRTNAIVLLMFLLIGPAWAYAFCWASSDDDFPEDSSRRRDDWLQILPWTFLLAPLVIPNLFLLVRFFRDSRADHGETWLGYGRSRPGGDRHDALR